jgi:hypothetical protein
MFQTAIAAQVKVVAGLELTAAKLGRAKLIYRRICIWAKTFARRKDVATLPILQFTRVAASLASI